MVQVPDEVKHERFDRLKAVIEKTTSEHSLSMVGGTYEVLVEGPSKKERRSPFGYARMAS
jgi:tRNA A37 methylthiotransferase MiaB